MLPSLEDIDLTGTSLESMAEKVSKELLTTGRAAIALQANGERVFWRFYKAEEILNWYEDPETRELRMVVFHESRFRPVESDPFQFENLGQYRVYSFDPTPSVKVYGEDLKEIEGSPLGNLTDDGIIPLPNLPVVIFNSVGVSTEPVNPPLLGLVDVNLSHYRSSADLEHTNHLTALATPWVSGKGVKLPKGVALGDGVLLQLGEGGNAGMLEVSGLGAGTISDSMEDKKNQMAALGARLLADPKNQAETAEAVRIRAAGDTATLSSIVNALDKGINLALQYHSDWAGLEEVTFETNRDWIDARLSDTDVAQLIELVQGGKISYQTFYEALQSGEWVGHSRTAEEEQALIDDETPDVVVSPQPQPPEESDE